MSSFQFLSRSISCCYSDIIKRSCESLFYYFNLNHFYYTRITNGGYFTSLDSHADWSQYYASEKLFLRTPYFRQPRLVRKGVRLLKDLRDSAYEDVYNRGKSKFDFNLTLQLIDEFPDGIEIFGFSSNFSNEMQIALLLNELPLIRLFTKKFREGNPFLFSKLEDNQIDIAGVIGAAFYESAIPTTPQCVARQDFLQKMGIRCGDPLTPRENDVIKLLLQGYSAGKIAPAIHLSKRTVEHHIERMKEKLGCDSKADLIQKARELERYGSL